ncbi:MAG: phosphopeptide-binding protein [Spirochaetaceae bacterium]|nr:MAG: phosphopeptide-binding protein [Spirochaetaceae bacterium]
MSLWIRRVLLCALGAIGGLAAWPAMEALLAAQVSFPSYLSFSLAGGLVFGLVFGAFFGSADGIVVGRWSRIGFGVTVGAAIGAVGGLIGFLVAQSVFLVIGESITRGEAALRSWGVPVSRAVGWAILGAFVGAAGGVRSLSPRKILIGVIGGLLGGAAGGAILEFVRAAYPSFGGASLIGLVVVGLSIGAAYAIVEKRLSFGVLRLLNGAYKGKEYILNQRKMSIGSAGGCDIVLTGYRNVEPVHARLLGHGTELAIAPGDPGRMITVNDQELAGRVLKYEDVVKIGSARLFFKHE